MQIITYTNTAEVIRLDKSSYLSNRQELDIPERFIAGQDVTAPVISISSPTIPTFNYVYIPTFNRYYFAGTPVWEGSNLWSIPLVTDLLYSFKDKILNLHGVASRLEDQGKYSMIIDDRITAEATQYEDIEFKPFNVVEGKRDFDIQSSDVAKIVFSCFSGEERTFDPVNISAIQAYDETGNFIALSGAGTNNRTGSTSTADNNKVKITAQNANRVYLFAYNTYVECSKNGDVFTSPPLTISGVSTTFVFTVEGIDPQTVTVKLNLVQ